MQDRREREARFFSKAAVDAACVDADIEKIAVLIKWSHDRAETAEKVVEALACGGTDYFSDPRFVGLVELTENPGRTWRNCARIASQGAVRLFEDENIEFALNEATRHGQNPVEVWEDAENAWLETHGSYC